MDDVEDVTAFTIGNSPPPTDADALKELTVLNLACKRSYALGTTLNTHVSQFMNSLMLGVAFEHYGYIRGKEIDFYVLMVSLGFIFFFSKMLTYVDAAAEEYPALSLGWDHVRNFSQLVIAYALFMAGRILSDYIFPVPSAGAWSIDFILRPMVLLVPLSAMMTFVQHLMDPSPLATFKRRTTAVRPTHYTTPTATAAN